jgi:hypothetical protein
MAAVITTPVSTVSEASVPLAISQISSRVNQRLRNCRGRFIDGDGIGAQVYPLAC